MFRADKYIKLRALGVMSVGLINTLNLGFWGVFRALGSEVSGLGRLPKDLESLGSPLQTAKIPSPNQ